MSCQHIFEFNRTCTDGLVKTRCKKCGILGFTRSHKGNTMTFEEFDKELKALLIRLGKSGRTVEDINIQWRYMLDSAAVIDIEYQGVRNRGQ